MQRQQVKVIKMLEKRIELFKDYQPTEGSFKFSHAFITPRSSEVEDLSHEILEEYLDSNTSLGEVFTCSVSIASEAVRLALERLGLSSKARINYDLTQ